MADRACLPVRAGRVLAAAALFLGGVLVGRHLPPLALPALGLAAGGGTPPAPPTGAAAAAVLRFPPALARVRINVGPNHDPLTPPADDPTAGVLAVEAQLGVAAALRRRLGRAHPHRFFVIAAALAGEPHVGFRSLHVYNRGGESSSLAAARPDRPWAAVGADRRLGGGVEFVPVLTLGRLLRAIPAGVAIPLLKIDAQGFDLTIIKSADRSALRRVDRVMAEVYENNKNYQLPDGVVNDLHAWVPHMARMGFALVNVSLPGGGEGDAFFDRVGDP